VSFERKNIRATKAITAGERRKNTKKDQHKTRGANSQRRREKKLGWGVFFDRGLEKKEGGTAQLWAHFAKKELPSALRKRFKKRGERKIGFSQPTESKWEGGEQK